MTLESIPEKQTFVTARQTTQTINGFSLIVVISFSAIIRLWAPNLASDTPAKTSGSTSLR